MTLAELNLLALEQERDLGYVDQDLDFAYIETVAEHIAATLSAGDCAEVAYQPLDGTFYGLVFTPLHIIVTAPAQCVDGREWERNAVRGAGMIPSGSYRPGTYLISWVDHACYSLRLSQREGIIHFSYVAEHWHTSPVSAVSLAILFRAIAERMS